MSATLSISVYLIAATFLAAIVVVYLMDGVAWARDRLELRRRKKDERMRQHGYDHAVERLVHGGLGMHIVQQLEREVLETRMAGAGTPYEEGMLAAAEQVRRAKAARDDAKVAAFKLRIASNRRIHETMGKRR